MPRKTNTATADKKALPQFSTELLATLVPGPITPGQFEDLVAQFKKAVIQRAMGAEMSHHLGYAPGQDKPTGVTNHRNGSSAKTVLTDTGAIDIDVPRDRQGSFEPQIVGKHERRFTGFDDKIIAKGSRRGPYLAPRPRDDGARDPGLPGRDVRRGRQPRPHQPRHRRRPGRGHPVAVPPLRAHVPGGLLRRPEGWLASTILTARRQLSWPVEAGNEFD